MVIILAADFNLFAAIESILLQHVLFLLFLYFVAVRTSDLLISHLICCKSVIFAVKCIFFAGNYFFCCKNLFLLLDIPNLQAPTIKFAAPTIFFFFFAGPINDSQKKKKSHV